MTEMDIKRAIEEKRAELNALPITLGFTDEHLRLSTELDKLLNKYNLYIKSVAE